MSREVKATKELFDNLVKLWQAALNEMAGNGDLYAIRKVTRPLQELIEELNRAIKMP